MNSQDNLVPVLSVEKLNFRRGEYHVLKDIDWRILPGEHWVILGANGCGKSSLIHCLTGYKMATSGQIRIRNAEFGKSDWREVRKSVGLVTNHLTTYLEPHESALAVVCSGREAMLNQVAAVPAEVELEAKELLHRFGCDALLKSPWAVLSQGEKQKILICRALMAKFEVLILDEPCAGLDPVARAKFLIWLNELLQVNHGPSIVLVTHHVEEIVPPFSHVLLLKQGRVFRQGLKNEMMKTEWLSEVYSADLELRGATDNYELVLKSVG